MHKKTYTYLQTNNNELGKNFSFQMVSFNSYDSV